MFYFIKSFLTRNIASYPRQIFVAGALLRTPSPRHSVIFFLILPFQNLELKSCSPSSERRTDTLKLLFKKASSKKFKVKHLCLQTSLKKDFGTYICLLILRNFSEDLFLKNSPKQLLLNTFHFFLE